MNRSIHLELAKWFWKKQLQEGDVAIDATCGNGHDTLFLAKINLSLLFAIDIQKDAIENTKKRLNEGLNEMELSKVILCQISHSDLQKIPCPKPPRLIVYNLGYLPRGNKTYTTKTDSTVASITSAVSILDEKGALSITCYPGHEEGKREEEAVMQFASSLPSNQWEVLYHNAVNRTHSPSLFWIARILTS